MDSIHSILPKVLRKRGLHGQAGASHIVFAAQRWLKGALPNFTDFLKVESLTHATLFISSTHSVASQECIPLLPELRAFLMKECEGIKITDIRIARRK
jgi:ribosomal protein S2